MAQNRPRYVSTFRAPTEYELEVERARRQKALAEALAQQEYQPMEGAAAPIPRAAPLVKALQGYLTARAGRQAEEAASKAGQMEEEYARRMAGRMEGGYVPDTAAMERIARKSRQRTQEEIMAAMPAETGLQEVTPTARYRKSPEEALAMASTGLGAAALKDRPIMAARLAKMLEQPKTAEFGTNVQFDDQNRAFVVNKAGEIRYLDGVKKPAEAPTALQRDYEYARSQGYKGSFEDFRQSGTPKTTVDVRYGAPVTGVNPQGETVFFQPNPTGGPPSIIPNVRPKPEAPGTEEAKSALFADRMSEAAPLLDILPPPTITATAKGSVPGVGNVLQSPENRQFNQAALNFITAVARKESGANIPDTEIETMSKTYIPMAGDDERTLEQKRRARESALRGLALSAGPQYKLAPIKPPEGIAPEVWAEMTLDERRRFAR